MERFVDFILPGVPGCPEKVIRNQVLESGIRFCRDSQIWEEKQVKSVAANALTVMLEPPANSAITAIAYAEQVNGDYDTERFEDFEWDGLNTLTFTRKITAAMTLNVFVALIPTRAATSLPDILFTTWFEGVKGGAENRLFIMDGKPWFNPKLAQTAHYLYGGSVGSAKLQALKKHDSGTRRRAKREFI